MNNIKIFLNFFKEYNPYLYMGYTYTGTIGGWENHTKELIYNLDKLVRPCYLPKFILNLLYYLAFGNFVWYVRNKFFYKFWNKHIQHRICDLHITDIKEKWGNLSIYYTGDLPIQILIDGYVEESNNICYECGTTSQKCKKIYINGWLTNICDKCESKLKK